jgi:hypothetical protein
MAASFESYQGYEAGKGKGTGARSHGRLLGSVPPPACADTAYLDGDVGVCWRLARADALK